MASGIGGINFYILRFTFIPTKPQTYYYLHRTVGN